MSVRKVQPHNITAKENKILLMLLLVLKFAFILHQLMPRLKQKKVFYLCINVHSYHVKFLSCIKSIHDSHYFWILLWNIIMETDVFCYNELLRDAKKTLFRDTWKPFLGLSECYRIKEIIVNTLLFYWLSKCAESF